MPEPAARKQTRYNWQIHHGSPGKDGRVVVEVAPWKGLLPRWRFVLPAAYKGTVKWGQGDTGRKEQFSQAAGAGVAEGGPVRMVNGPEVVWFGAVDPLSTATSAFLEFSNPPPHYIMFGQAPEPDAPPADMEGITFKGDTTHQHSHGEST